MKSGARACLETSRGIFAKELPLKSRRPLSLSGVAVVLGTGSEGGRVAKERTALNTTKELAAADKTTTLVGYAAANCSSPCFVLRLVLYAPRDEGPGSARAAAASPEVDRQALEKQQVGRPE